MNGSTFENTIESIHSCLKSAAEKAMSTNLLNTAELAVFNVEVPADTKNADFASNIAMVNAKTFGMPPRKIAESIVQCIDTSVLPIDRIEIAGPGFINIFMRQEWFSQLLLEILSCGESFGRTNYGNGERVMVEFVSANPTGPMHIGNARGGALGDAMAEVLSWAGHDVTREFYINDAGNQIEKMGMSLEARYMQTIHGESSFEFPEDGYKGEDIIELAKEFIAEFGDKLQAGAELRSAMIDFCLPKNIAKMKSDLERYNVNFDIWFSEKTLHQTAIEEAIAVLENAGAVYEKDGAVWYRATSFGGEKDEVLKRANGIPTYFAADIAYHYNKLKVRDFSRAINIWGADHHGHIARLKGAMTAMGIDENRLTVVLMQLVRLIKDGELCRMSKRSGKAITLSTLLDEVPLDAARFFFVMREAGSTLDFDLDLAVEEDSKNPVYYVQYAHARCCAVLRNLSALGKNYSLPNIDKLEVLNTTYELELIRSLAMLPMVINSAAKTLDPAKLCSFAQTTAAKLHKFYYECRIKDEPDKLLYPRLALCEATRQVLSNVLKILKVSAPEVM